MTTVAKALDDTERQAIADLIRTGKSRNEVAQLTGRAPDTVSRIALDIGWTFGQTNAARAHEARSAYAQEARAELARGAMDRAKEIIAGFGDPQAVVVQTKDGAFPIDVALDARGQKDRAQAVQLLTRTVLDIDRHDARTDEGKAKGLLERIVEGLEAAS